MKLILKLYLFIYKHCAELYADNIKEWRSEENISFNIIYYYEIYFEKDNKNTSRNINVSEKDKDKEWNIGKDNWFDDYDNAFVNGYIEIGTL